jgi:hypothetical protein
LADTLRVPLDDQRLRLAAFAYLDRLQAAKGEHLNHVDLKAFMFEGRNIPLVGQRGIRVVSGLQSALSITTTYRKLPDQLPYADELGPDMYLRYRWQGTDPRAFDNRALEAAWKTSTPLIYFLGVETGFYHPTYPVWIVGWEPEEHRVVVALNGELRAQWDDPHVLQHPGPFFAPTHISVPFADSATRSFSMPRTSKRTQREASPSFRTASHCAPSTIEPLMPASSESDRTTSWRSGETCYLSTMDQPSSTRFSSCTWRDFTFRSSPSLSRTRTFSPSDTSDSDSLARADQRRTSGNETAGPPAIDPLDAAGRDVSVTTPSLVTTSHKPRRRLVAASAEDELAASPALGSAEVSREQR